MFPRPPPIKKWPIKLRFAAAAILIAAALVASGLQSAKTNSPRFVALDIGQGDALYIRTPTGHDLLIDGGPSPRTSDILKAHLPAGDKELDLVIATHLDADHSGGIAGVLEEFSVGSFITNGAEPKTKTANNLFEVAAKKQLTPKVLTRGMRIQSDGWVADVLWPPGDFKSTETNEAGLVVRFKTATETFLLTADISSEIEQKLLDFHTPLSSTVLKVGHHGSKTSSSDNFLAAVGAARAVISAGKDNRYGHPTSEVLERLDARGINILRTDQDGHVTIPFE